MHRPLFPTALGCTTLVCTLTMACNDVTSPAPTAQPLSQSAAIVNRFTGDFFDFIIDESQDLAAIIGLAPEDFAAACAGEVVPLDQVRIVEVIRPDGSIKITIHGTPRVTVYSAPGISDICELAEETPLATGQVRVNGTDNDVAVSHKRTNSFGRRLMGTASGPGGSFRVRGSFRATIDRGDNLVFRNFRFSITPLGG